MLHRAQHWLKNRTAHLPQTVRGLMTAGTPLGVEAQRYMDAGEYVPDSVTNAMVRDRLAEPDARGF